ncbi:MAG: beta-galactosidase GalA [Terriglobales bacterium]
MSSSIKPSRRDVLKTGAAAAAAAALPARALGQQVAAAPAGPPAPLTPAPPPFARRVNIDADWRFNLGDADHPAQDFGFGRNQETFAKANYAAAPARARFDDSAWQSVSLPHDWAVDLPFHEDRRLTAHGSKPLGRDYPATSIGWYRRVIAVPADLGADRLGIEFDGVFRDAAVFLNGEYLGKNFSGYAPFRFDLTDLAEPGRDNILAVRVDATLGEGWFYEGAGIYRHVWLTRTHPLHFAPDAVVVRALPSSGGRADVRVSAAIRNQTGAARRCRLNVTLVDPAGRRLRAVRSAAVQAATASDAETETATTVGAASLWSPATPHLYRAICRLEAEGAVTDEVTVTFGIRSLRFDAARGFFLNGERIELKGTCNHQDHAGVGSALPDGLQTYRVHRLQAMGSNAYRTSHNPPTPELLDACDRLGMLVMDETRMMASTPEGLSQLERLIRRDRNHPCVVLWSLGNEEPQQGTPVGARVNASMKRLARQLDPTRPVTLAMNGGWGRGASAVVDVQGFNYGNGGGSAKTADHIDAFHGQFPAKPCFGSETASAVSTRGIYEKDPVRGYVSAYDTNFPSYALNAEGWWTIFAARPFLAGGFAWTGFDYRGEPSPYGWPCISSHFGIMDTCGFAKDSFYYYQAWWSGQPVLHLFPHWNWAGREGQPIAVWCHTNCAEVELFVNGRSLGTKRVEPQGHLQWQVPYAAGVIEARGRTDSGTALVARRETTGPAAQLALSAESFPDAHVVRVEVRDARGRLMPTADNLIRFALDGPGRILGVGNGDPSSHEPDHAAQRSAFNGLCQVLVAPTGAAPLTLQATADGLAPATLRLS